MSAIQRSQQVGLWAAEAAGFPPRLVEEQTENELSFVVTDGWGHDSFYINEIYVTSAAGEVVDTLVSDMWFFSKQNLPRSMHFQLTSKGRPSQIVISNGQGESGVKNLAVSLNGDNIWRGEIPISTEHSVPFKIVVPVKVKRQLPASKTFDGIRPTLQSFREMNVRFSLDIDDS